MCKENKLNVFILKSIIDQGYNGYQEFIEGVFFKKEDAMKKGAQIIKEWREADEVKPSFNGEKTFYDFYVIKKEVEGEKEKEVEMKGASQFS